MKLPKPGDTIKIYGVEYKVKELESSMFDGYYYTLFESYSPVNNLIPTYLSENWFVQNPLKWALSEEMTNTISVGVKPHNHLWRHYEGIYNQYDFCEECGEKKE